MNGFHLGVALAEQRQHQLLREAEVFRLTRIAAAGKARPVRSARRLARRLVSRLVAAASSHPARSPVAESR